MILLFSGILLNSCTNSLITSAPRSKFKNQKQARLWHHAQTFLGTPYRLGGINRSGMDCSGLVVRVYRDVYGIKLPHNTLELIKKGSGVSLRSLEVGHLIFFRTERGTQPSHVGIYLGKGVFIHASRSEGVILSKLKKSYYKRRFTGARKIGVY